MESFGGLNSESLGRIDFFISHEGLHLDYETALTRRDPLTGNTYNQGAHMLWIGERTRHYDGGHVEYFRGISNPIGIKFGSSMKPEELLRLMDRLDPCNIPGRLTLIPRMGHLQAEKSLPRLLEAVKREGRSPAWSCDPMHGNTTSTSSGIKTRNFNHILKELKTVLQIHSSAGTTLAGVHFELTGEDVTECLGGAERLGKSDLATNYATTCDPRLNYSQSLEIAFLIAMHLKKGN
jgi:3-deoxy-7-phosphoheptulonate synthase